MKSLPPALLSIINQDSILLLYVRPINLSTYTHTHTHTYKKLGMRKIIIIKNNKRDNRIEKCMIKKKKIKQMIDREQDRDRERERERERKSVKEKVNLFTKISIFIALAIVTD